jgi:hypothetical protein
MHFRCGTDRVALPLLGQSCNSLILLLPLLLLYSALISHRLFVSSISHLHSHRLSHIDRLFISSYLRRRVEELDQDNDDDDSDDEDEDGEDEELGACPSFGHRNSPLFRLLYDSLCSGCASIANSVGK